MSISIADIMKLPCLKDARVVGGFGGLSKTVSSVTVLEFADPNALQEEMIDNIDFYGSEIVITAFANIVDNVEQQCTNIRRLAGAGEVGMILFYVGVLMPGVDQRLIDLANELDFALIVMPENRLNLRYSEVICEVMEAIFKDQTTEVSLVTDVLDQMCRLPEHQRTVDGVLRMTRDRIRTTLILTDSNQRVLGQANWPMSMGLQLDELPKSEVMQPVSLPNSRTLWHCPLDPNDPKTMQLYLVKDGLALSKELVLQTVELVRLAVSLWSSRHAEVRMSELVRAILRDEPLKMRRLADLFHIDVASIHSMWVLRCEDDQQVRFDREALQSVREVLAHQCETVIADHYEGYIVAFMSWPGKGENTVQLGDDLIEQLRRNGLNTTLVRCYKLAETVDVRKAFLLLHNHLDDAVSIWPKKQSYTLSEVDYAAQCRRIVDAGESSLAEACYPLKALGSGGEENELLDTLTCYLLDAESSVSRCAERLFLHKNTIKYRLGRISALLECPVDKEPEKYVLYRAAALRRLMGF